MDLFVYSDESGVFNKTHQDFFVYGGLVFLSKEEKVFASRKYISIERIIASSKNSPIKSELKSSNLVNKDKSKLFKATNNFNRFGAVIFLKDILPDIFTTKKSK